MVVFVPTQGAQALGFALSFLSSLTRRNLGFLGSVAIGLMLRKAASSLRPVLWPSSDGGQLPGTAWSLWPVAAFQSV